MFRGKLFGVPENEKETLVRCIVLAFARIYSKASVCIAPWARSEDVSDLRQTHAEVLVLIRHSEMVQETASRPDRSTLVRREDLPNCFFYNWTIWLFASWRLNWNFDSGIGGERNDSRVDVG